MSLKFDTKDYLIVVNFTGPTCLDDLFDIIPWWTILFTLWGQAQFVEGKWTVEFCPNDFRHKYRTHTKVRTFTFTRHNVEIVELHLIVWSDTGFLKFILCMQGRWEGNTCIVLLKELEFHIVYSHDLAENQFENLENIINKDRR